MEVVGLPHSLRLEHRVGEGQDVWILPSEKTCRVIRRQAETEIHAQVIHQPLTDRSLGTEKRVGGEARRDAQNK
jgi:hypothetical protein